MAKQNEIARAEDLLYQQDIEIAPTYTYPDENDNCIDDEIEPRIKPFDPQRDILGDYYESINTSNGFWKRVRKFLAASNKAGRKAKILKDFILLFAPWGDQVSNLTELVTEIFIKEEKMKSSKNNPVKDVLERAFTKDGGGIFRIRDKDGSISLIAIAALVIRLLLLAGFLYLLNAIGVPVEQGLHALGL